MILTLPDGRHAGLTDTAFERWHECTCPLRPPRWAAELLRDVVDLAGYVVPVPPPWVHLLDRNQVLGRTWLIAGDYAFIVLPSKGAAPWVIVSVIPRGDIPPIVRLQRNRVNAIERRRRAARRRHDDARGGARARRRELRALDVDHAG